MSVPIGNEKVDARLMKYTEAVEAVKQHEESNKSVFDSHKKLIMKVIDAENDLRDEAAASTEGMKKGVPMVMAENGEFRIIVQLDVMKIYDDEKIIAKGLEKEVVSYQDRPPRITISQVRTPKA